MRVKRRGVKRQSGSIYFRMLKRYTGLLFLTGAALVAVLAAQFHFLFLKQADSHARKLAAVTASNIMTMLEQVDQLSVTILSDPTVQKNLKLIPEKESSRDRKTGAGSAYAYRAAISEQLRSSILNAKHIISVRVYPIEGEEIFVGTTNRNYLSYPMTAEEIYEGNGAMLCGVDPESKYLCFGRAILSLQDMQPLGYLVIACENDFIEEELFSTQDAYASRIYILNEKSVILASNESDMVSRSFPFSIEQLKKERPRELIDLASQEETFCFVEEGLHNGWYLVTTVSREQFREMLVGAVWIACIFFAVIMALAFGMTVVTTRRLLAPTTELVKTMSEFGEGRLDVRTDVRGKDEFGKIGEAYNRMADNIQNLMEKVYALELTNKEAEIEFLKMQINPHFLYNSLDTISWLGFASGNEQITEISVALAKLLRASVKGADVVTVREELQTVESYLLIQKCRFEDRIEIERQISGDAYDCRMPAFLLQPIIENSIIHGLEDRLEGGKLKLAVRREGDWLYFSVEDDGKGMDRERLESLKRQFRGEEPGKSIGLSNVCRRLELLYGEICRFTVESGEAQGTRVSFRIPVEIEKENN